LRPRERDVHVRIDEPGHERQIWGADRRCVRGDLDLCGRAGGHDRVPVHHYDRSIDGPQRRPQESGPADHC
jgi:hypothetical protein